MHKIKSLSRKEIVFGVKTVFQLRVFYAYVQARKSLNPLQYYINLMFWWREFSILYDLACFSDFIG